MNETVIHDFLPYSEAIRWTLQKDYFEQRGPEAWRQRDIPFRVTSNSLAAKQNVLMVLDSISAQQHIGSLNKSDAIVILELGCGLGLFAYHFLRQFELICQEQNRSDFSRLQYVATDYVQSNVEAITQYPHMQLYLKSGHLQVGQIDSARAQYIHRYCTQTHTFTESQPLPLLSAVIANYMHCCLPGRIIGKITNVWHEKRVQSTIALQENEVQSGSSLEQILRKPNAIDRVKEHGQWIPIAINDVCINAAHQAALNDITTHQANTSFISSEASLINITEISQILHPMAIYLIHDKACVNQNAHTFNDIYDHTNHGNSTAYMVNFPLLLTYATQIGLNTYLTRSPSYTVQTLMIQKGDSSTCQDTFRLIFQNFNLNQHMSDLFRLAHDCLASRAFSLAAHLYEKFIDRGAEDPDVFLNLAKALIALGDTHRAQEMITQGRHLDHFQLMNFDHLDGLVAHAQGHKENALRYLKRALAQERDPNTATDIQTLISVYNK
ncbi:MAG: hypothetical protein P8104_02635 [Gammaproteobacteria bacterium]